MGLNIFSTRVKSFAIITLLSSFVYRGTGNEQKPELSQTVPPDMIFVQGNDSVHSFYISITEEPNINWRIYADWLKKVFVDYPEAYRDALPLRDMQLTATRYNDPIIDNYANHPAYNYYPILGVSWRQIQNYLQWKTDRLNEMILIKNGFLDYDIQQNEENFNTESFLEGQYDGKYEDRKKHQLLTDAARNRTSGFSANPFIMKKGIFIPQFRLPTEAEWDYASLVNKEKIRNGESYSIYGLNYFLKPWNKNAQNEIGKKYNLYPNTNTMESGVQEWLIDMEGFEYKSVYGSFNIYVNNGFEKTEKILHVFDSDGFVNVKDSLGKLLFLFVDYDNTNKPIYISQVGHDQYENYKIIDIANPFYQNDSLFEKYKEKNYYIGKYPYWISEKAKEYYISTKAFQQAAYDIIKYLPKQRKVKSGNWKKPGRQTVLLNENEASELIGFRCVLPATSVAVDPKYKVKWD